MPKRGPGNSMCGNPTLKSAEFCHSDKLGVELNGVVLL
jgi:hypothetical protein